MSETEAPARDELAALLASLADGEGLPETIGPVLFYTPQVIDHFEHPRNLGELPAAETSGFAIVGDPACGDQMKLWLGVRDGRIDAIRFKSYGCPGAIATSSMLTELVRGRAVTDARGITDDEVIAALGGIPEQKRHCSLLGVRALQAALEDWERRGSPGA